MTGVNKGLVEFAGKGRRKGSSLALQRRINSTRDDDALCPLKSADDADTATAFTVDSTNSSCSLDPFISGDILLYVAEADDIENATLFHREGEQPSNAGVDVIVTPPSIPTGHASSSYSRRFLPVPLRCKTNKDMLIWLLYNECRWKHAAARIKTAEGKKEIRSVDRCGDGTFPLHHVCGCGASLDLVEAILTEYPEAAQVADKLNGNLPIHYTAYREDASPQVVQLLLDFYPDGARVANDCGWLPIHYAASAEAPLPVLRSLIDVHPNGAAAQDGFGNLPVHHLSFAKVNEALLKPILVSKVELLLQPILHDAEACRAKSAIFGGMLPLHVAAKLCVSIKTLQALLQTYHDGATVACWDVDRRQTYPDGAKVSCWDIDCRRYKSHGPIGTPDKRYALDFLEDQRPLIGTAKEIAEFDEKSDLLFFYHSNLRKYRTEARLDRIISRVAQTSSCDIPAWPLRLSSSKVNYPSTVLALMDGDIQEATGPPSLGQNGLKESVMDGTSNKLNMLNELRSDFFARIAFTRKRDVASFNFRRDKSSNRRHYYEVLPLHFSLESRATTEKIEEMLDKSPKLATVANKQGLLPLHVAAAQGAPKRLLELLFNNYPQAATTQDCAGDLPVHHLARYLSRCKVLRIDSIDSIHLLLHPISEDREACKSTGSVGVVLPLHVAAEYVVDRGIFEEILAKYPCAASQLQVRPGTRNQYALDIIESKRRRKACALTWNDDFNLKCDLIFAYNPSTDWCPPGSQRLHRLQNRLRVEAERCQRLTAISEKIWVWMCTHGHYEDTVKTILNGLPLETLQRMAKIKKESGLTVMECSTSACRQVIRLFLLFAGRYAIEETETPLHVSPTSIVLRARDFGQKSNTDDLNGETSCPVVIKLMHNKEHFQRERSSREGIDLVDGKFPPVVEFEEDFDVDRGENRDIQFRDSIKKFGCCDFANYRYALVMKEADRTLDDIRKHECPSMNEIRLITEQIGKALYRLHRKNIVHADVKHMNVVRLSSHITMIDLDSSCRIAGRDDCGGDEFAGSKFSSGVLPPEMIYELKDSEEARDYTHYWETEARDFEKFEVLQQDFNHETHENLRKLFARCDHLKEDPNWKDEFTSYTNASSVFEQLASGCSSAQELHEKWFILNRNACRWRKLKPKRGINGRMYVVKSFQRGREAPLPYTLVPASVSLDMWSFGVLLYSLCTNTSLFTVNCVTGDLDTGEAMEELAKWHLDKATCQQKLSRVTNELVSGLLQKLLQSDPKKRPRSFNEVIGHDFFRPVNAKQRLEQEMQDLQEELRSEAKGREEFQDLAKSVPFRDLFRRRKWEVVKMKIKEEPSAVPRDLLHEACKHGPPHDVLQTIIRFEPTLFRERNVADDLPIHLACLFGAEVQAFKLLVGMYPESLSIKNKLGETPLDTAQSNVWTHSRQKQATTIDFLRRSHFPGFFDSTQMTALPQKSAFAEWAHMAPPGSRSAKAAIVLSIDISGFKAVNDHAGPDIGDSTIKDYATHIQDICRSAETMESAHLRSIVNVFRMGGDEFAVVVMFEVNNYKSSLRKIWNRKVEQMVMDISVLEQNGHGRKGNYFTFPRIGCSAGEVSNVEDMTSLRVEAEKLQEEVKELIHLTRGESVALHDIRTDGTPNVKLCDALLNLQS